MDRYADYDGWASLYNETLGPQHAAEVLPILERLWLGGLTPECALLDLCCGTGQLAAALTQRRYRVTGLDGSELMLDFARTNAPQAEFVLADARSFHFSNEFAGVYCTGAALNHIGSLEELRAVFQRVVKVLRAGGSFILEMNTAEYMRLHWHGQPTIGGIIGPHAWISHASFDTARRNGRFTLDLFRDPQPERARHQWAPLRSVMQRMANGALSRGLLLWILERYDRFQPTWKHSRLTYDVYGYGVTEIAQAARRAGFRRVEVQDAHGAPYSAPGGATWFVCLK